MVIERLPWAVTIRNVTPGRATAEHPENPVQNLARGTARPSGLSSRWNQGLDERPLVIRQLVATYHNLSSNPPIRGGRRGEYPFTPFSDRA